MQSDINASVMPPWPPDPDFSQLKDQRVLSDYEISQINDWVNGGMPLGDTTYAPQQPVYTNASELTFIDDSIQIPTYTINNEGDTYRGFVIHSDYTSDKLLNEIEVIPGNPSVVHHLFVFQDTSNYSWDLDQQTLEPGFPGISMEGFSPYAQMLFVWGPGNGVTKFPSNMGITVPAGADYIISIHYAPYNDGEVDSKNSFQVCRFNTFK